MKIGTKAQADKLIVESLFKPENGRTLRAIKYSSGKYKADPQTPYIGREVEVDESVRALYTVRGKDSDGAYVRIMCVTAN
jgi:hypothetical protein